MGHSRRTTFGRFDSRHRHILLIGDDPHLALVLAVAERLHWGVRCVRVATIDEAREFAASHRVLRMVLSPGMAAPQPPLLDTRGKPVATSQAQDVLNMMVGRLSLSTLNPTSLAASILRPRAAYGVAKRTIDVAVSLVGTIMLAIPVMLYLLVTCAMQRRWTGVARRLVIGQGGMPLSLPVLTPGEGRLSGSEWHGRLGALLRETGLEYAPCLLEVLFGRLSLVGPRPVSPADHEAGVELNRAYEFRYLVRPGIVGLPQVRSTYSTATRDKRIALEYDLYYLANRSIALDGRILARGIYMLLKRWGRFARRVMQATARRLTSLRRRVSKGVGPARLASVPLPVDQDGRPLPTEPCVIIGAGSGGRILARELINEPGVGYWPVAFLDDDPDLIGTRIHGVPVVGNVESLPAIAEREQVGVAIIAIPSAGEITIQRISQIANAARLRIQTMPSIGGLLRGQEATQLRPVPTRDLLGRQVVTTDAARARECLAGKRVLITGASGSIGSEVVRQAVRGEPTVIFGLDSNESGLYDLQQELRAAHPGTEFVPIVASVTDEARINRLMARFRPDIVFHAAAYKHVPLMEDYPHEAVTTNIRGTFIVTEACRRANVERFVLVSTDKAVRPTSVMGATKRIAELVVREAALHGGLNACSVRFGNVLGSRGSVIPLFEKQIAEGGPVTITDKRMTRYFMTIPEAAGLIIEAGAFGERGVIYMLDMGEPVRIVDVAERLIRLHGKRPGIDIEIAYTGLRPGEKLFEELALDFESARLTPHSKIRILDEGLAKSRLPVSTILDHLTLVIATGNPEDIRHAVMETVMTADGIETALMTPRQSQSATGTA